MENFNKLNRLPGNNISNKEEVIDLVTGVEKELPSPFTTPLPFIPYKVGDLFPVIIHERAFVKGRNKDKGWKIKWFDDEFEASENRNKYKAEAESFRTEKSFFDSFTNLESSEKYILPEILYPSIEMNPTKEEVMQFSRIENYEFRNRIISHHSDFSLDGRMRDYYWTEEHLFFKEGDTLLISVVDNVYGRSRKDYLKHYYEIAVQNGGDKKNLDDNLLQLLNSGLENTNKEIAEQFNAIDWRFLDDYYNIPKLLCEDIELKKAYNEVKDSIEGSVNIDNIEDYWENHLTLESSIKYKVSHLNSELTKWNHFWKGSFNNFCERINSKEILVNYGNENTGHDSHGVIRPNGESRPPTLVDWESNEHWDIVLPDELACIYDRDGNYISKYPNKLTNEQKDFLIKIRINVEEQSEFLNRGLIENDAYTDEDKEESEQTLDEKLQVLKNKFKKG